MTQARHIARERWDAIDVARGAAIAAMISYHFAWDLSFYRLIATNVVLEPAWIWYARAIAGAFLLLVGVGLALAHAGGFRRTPFLKRLLKVAGAALLITVATRIAFPESYIFFGILHAIAALSVLALPFLWLPAWTAMLAALACFAAPFLLTQAAFDTPWLDWLGLGETDPRTNDYVPVFPWFAMVLIGIALGRALMGSAIGSRLARWRAKGPLARGLIKAGRWSLPIYLVHQPILLGVLFVVAQAMGPNLAAHYHQDCQISCMERGSEAAFCRRFCACTAEGLKRETLWDKALADGLSPQDQGRVSSIVQQCLRAEPPS